MLKKHLLFPAVIAVVLFVSGCATIIHGSKQTVGISSNPTKATVTIDGQLIGETPVSTILTRGDNHIVSIELPGYMPYETNLIRKVDGWIAGNIIFGGLIGLAVDAISGGMYKLTPEQIHSELLNQTADAVKSGNVYLFITLNPDPEWEMVYTMKKL
jgi:hypothetical protein